MKTEVEIIKVTENKVATEKDFVAREMTIPLFINDTPIYQFDCSPSHLKELVTGFLYTEGWVKEIDEIVKMETKPEKILVYLKESKKYELQKINITKESTSYNPESLWELMAIFQNKSILFQETGGFHAAALATAKEIVYFFEDIGRHNAIDKVLGCALLGRVKLNDKILLTTCRLSHKIVCKAIRVGIPIVASRAAVTDKAIKLAREFNLTLVGFAREKRMNIYNNCLLQFPGG
ncbi:MAG: formate dehydrogenase accessory sulfurtransferase FdhD [Candidatus Desulfofervidaceae bacterium]|nr:formate dehydrogenase accessory sulfurtransferase FdhD [Candidatus Desulfofervidaceae bacterium]